MMDPEFATRVIARLDPVLAPRGFPCQRSSASPDSVLFHCDGPRVDEVAARYPAWFARVQQSYSPDRVICLDLWVQQDKRQRWVEFENVTAGDLAGAVGGEAVELMHALATGLLDAWVDQVALVFDVYFDSIRDRS
jgi:hypothetical protein